MGKYSINKLPSDILQSTAEKVSILRKECGWTQQIWLKDQVLP